MKQRLRILAGLPALCLLGAAHDAAAQSYPNKTITISIATAAGSAPDAIIRAMAQKMNEAWKQPVIVENRATAGGITAVTTVTKSPPDGHTLLVHTAAFTIAPAMYKLPYDTFRDLLPVSIIAYVPNMLVAHPTLPVKNVKELIALAKARAGDLNYASSGSGTPAHLAGELFKSMAGINILHVPYKGSPPALTSVLSGETSMLFSPLTIAVPHTKSGKLRALGVTTAKRSKLVPELPTIGESGLPGYEVTQWYGMQAPAGTPKDVIARINGEIGKILAMPDIVEKLVLFGAEAAPSTPEFMTAYVKSEVEKWAKVVKASGAKAD
ncbi:MAG: tripartite tricarboxylate transporter substrate binding protein [Burkholderiales bacterium]|jgi:tripartite-type tricarboxylate transporter receptor subunit TctC